MEIDSAAVLQSWLNTFSAESTRRLYADAALRLATFLA
jgi:hypothetical protein